MAAAAPPALAAPPLSRASHLWALALLLGCGGTPKTPDATPGAPGLHQPVLTLSTTPAALSGLFGDVDQALAPGVGPLSALWTKVRQRVADALEGAGDAPEAWRAWGLSPDAPLHLQVGVPGGTALARALVARLAKVEAETPPYAWQLRIIAGLQDRAALLASLRAVAGRFGLESCEEGKPPCVPGELVWWARDPELGIVAALRIVGSEAVLDLAGTSHPEGIDAGVGPLLAEGPAPQPSSHRVSAVVDLAALGRLETALDAARGLRSGELEAAVEVAAVCGARWGEVAEAAPRLNLSLGEDLRLDFRPRTPWPVRALPLGAVEAPAMFQLGLPLLEHALVGFEVELPRCALGALTPLATLLRLPEVLSWTRLPLPNAPAGMPRTARGVAAAVLGAKKTQGGAVPRLGVVLRTGAALEAQPLGPEATQNPRGVWRLDGPLALELAAHQGRVAFTLGASAWDLLLPPAPTDAERFAVLHLDPEALAEILGAAGQAGAGVEALAALGARLGRLEVEGHQRAGRVEWRLTLDRRKLAK